MYNGFYWINHSSTQLYMFQSVNFNWLPENYLSKNFSSISATRKNEQVLEIAGNWQYKNNTR